MDFKDLVQKRRSVRKFTEEELTGEQVQTILRAGLMSPTSKSTRAWHFLVVDDKDTLEKIALCKSAGAEFVKNAPLAVVVLMDTEATDVWVEDGSIAAVTMQYQAADLGLGSCWAQIRNRGIDDGTPANDVLRFIFNYPETWQAVCVVAFGYPAIERKPQSDDNLKWENVVVRNS